MNARDFYGISVPPVTPFRSDGSLDLDSYRKLVKGIADAGAHGVVVNGTTGESPCVDWAEVEALVAVALEVAKAAPSRLRVILGTGSTSTEATVRHTRRARELGVDAALVVVPYYNRPSQAGIVAHFARVADLGLPILCYNIPYRTGVAMSPATLRAVLQMDGVVGLKESSGTLANTLDLAIDCDKAVLCGEDALLLASLACGGHGGILAAANVRTREYVRVYQEIQAGDLAAARQRFLKLLPLIKLLFEESNPGPLKWLLAKEGRIASPVQRLPLVEISEDLKRRLEAAAAAIPG